MFCDPIQFGECIALAAFLGSLSGFFLCIGLVRWVLRVKGYR